MLHLLETHRHIGGMDNHRLPSDYATPYRILVRAGANLRRKDFIWEIVHESSSSGATLISKASTRSFPSMAEAYADGAVALATLRNSL